MLIANKFEVPDKCPEDCKFIEDLKHFGQNAKCVRCPVLICVPHKMGVDVEGHGPVPDAEADHFVAYYVVDPEDYREDWAEAWSKFFVGEVEDPS